VNLNDAVEELSRDLGKYSGAGESDQMTRRLLIRDALTKWGDSRYREGIGHGHQDVYEARRLAEDAERKAEKDDDRGE
jgi:hypothetical protein